MTDAVAAQKPGALVRESAGGGTEVAVRAETQAEAMTARAQAEVYGAMQLAKRFPRDMDVVFQNVLKDCRRPAFAEKSRFAIRRGDTTITGWTIRFAEGLVRRLGNLYVNQAIVYDDADKRIVSVRVIDLETNNTVTQETTVSKTVERKYIKAGQRVISQRLNSEGKTVYLVEATEDEVLQKQGVAVSKAIRNCVIRLAPADLLEEAETTVAKALAGEFAANPDEVRRRVLDSFLSLNIAADEVKRYLGHDVSSCSPAEIQELRELFAALKEGQTTWKDSVAAKLDRESASFKCEECGAGVTATMAATSKRAHGRVLCKEHRPKEEPKEATKQPPAQSTGEASAPPATASDDAPAIMDQLLFALDELNLNDNQFKMACKRAGLSSLVRADVEKLSDEAAGRLLREVSRA